MADEVEVETKDLQETIEEIHKEREERENDARQFGWTKYVALTTAVLAAFAAVAALQSGALANEGMMHQLQASDTWNEYQASKQKSHTYTIGAAALLDSHVVASPKPKKSGSVLLVPESAPDRLSEYLDEVKKETAKVDTFSKKAKQQEEEAERQLHAHHEFAYSVALLQVAIALGAVSALTRIKVVWLISGALGIVGIVLFVMGFVAL